MNVKQIKIEVVHDIMKFYIIKIWNVNKSNKFLSKKPQNQIIAYEMLTKSKKNDINCPTDNINRSYLTRL